MLHRALNQMGLSRWGSAAIAGTYYEHFEPGYLGSHHGSLMEVEV